LKTPVLKSGSRERSTTCQAPQSPERVRIGPPEEIAALRLRAVRWHASEIAARAQAARRGPWTWRGKEQRMDRAPALPMRRRKPLGQRRGGAVHMPTAPAAANTRAHAPGKKAGGARLAAERWGAGWRRVWGSGGVAETYSPTNSPTGAGQKTPSISIIYSHVRERWGDGGRAHRARTCFAWVYRRSARVRDGNKIPHARWRRSASPASRGRAHSGSQPDGKAVPTRDRFRWLLCGCWPDAGRWETGLQPRFLTWG
jgi:hypothetical protein